MFMKRERAHVENRRNRIIEIMKDNPEVRVDQLANVLEVSLITIRRDLQFLEEQKLLIRTYGGAVSTSTPESKEDERQMYRRLIAQYAATCVSDGDTLFLNTSRNALDMLQYVDRDNVRVITNNGKAIYSGRGTGVSVVLTGGELRQPKDAMVGDFAVRNLQMVFAKKAFMGCSGISAEAGMTTEKFNEVSINELMINHATQDVYLLADHTKIGANSSFTSCLAERINYLITDEKAPEDVLELLRSKGVQIHQVRKGDF